MRIFKIIAVGAGIALATAGVASASTVNLGFNGKTEFGSASMFKTVKFKLKNSKGKIRSGMYDLSNGASGMTAFSMNVRNNLSNGAAYNVAGTSSMGAGVDTNIDKLFTSAFGSVNTAVEAAAFQLALWEIIYNGNNLNVRKGKFKVTGGNNAVIKQAQAYLKGLSSAGTGGYNVQYLNGGAKARLVAVSPVPVPASLGMLGLGIAGLVAMRRRKAATAA